VRHRNDLISRAKASRYQAMYDKGRLPLMIPGKPGGTPGFPSPRYWPGVALLSRLFPMSPG